LEGGGLIRCHAGKGSHLELGSFGAILERGCESFSCKTRFLPVMPSHVQAFGRLGIAV
jgi:hypothetical protein